MSQSRIKEPAARRGIGPIPPAALALSLVLVGLTTSAATVTVSLDAKDTGRVFEGIGAVSAGASTRLLYDYAEPYRSDVLDFLFKPKFGAGFQHLKVEIGGGENSTCGSEPSHAITRDELVQPKARGYEFWLMKEGRYRNPKLILDCLPWCYSGWMKDRFSQDSADWFRVFLDVAKTQYALDVDWISAAQNENGTDRDWIVKILRPTLNAKGYSKVKLQAPDDDSEYWQIFQTFASDPAYRDAVQAVGYHYMNGREPWQIDQVSKRDATPEAKRSGKPLWASEDWSMSGGTWDGTGALFSARLINKFYIRDRITKTELWCPIDSIYEGLPWSDTGVMQADRPWSGHYFVWPAVWAVAHTTQFAEPGWQYLDGGCGQLDPRTWKGSYVTLKDPATGDWSLIACTDGETTLTLKVGAGLKRGPVHVWKSDASTQFVQIQDFALVDGTLSIALTANSIYSLTTTVGQTKGHHSIPADKSFPFPYAEDFESYAAGESPKYFSDQKGTFEVWEEPGHGKCLKQIVPQEGHMWEYMKKVLKPYTVIGDQKWQDYALSADVQVKGGDVEVGGRFQDQNQLSYRWILARDGNWKLNYQGKNLGSGTLSDFDRSAWHNLKLVLAGETLKGFIDGRLLTETKDGSVAHGMPYLASTYDGNLFDNVRVMSP